MNKGARDRRAATTPPPHAQFRKSSYSGTNGQCVEVAPDGDCGRWLRDSKDRNQPPLYFTAGEWEAFVRGVKDGQFD